MRKIIKTDDMSIAKLSVYEHDELYTLEGGPDGRSYVDPAAILAEARADAERLVREAYAEGLRRGEAAGRQSAEEQFVASIAEAAAMLKAASGAIESARAAFLEDTGTHVARLAVAAAERIVRREVSLDREIVKATARAALEKLTGEERVQLRVHPADLDAIRLHRVDLLERFEGLRQLDVSADETVSPGGCIAETSGLVVDAGIETQLAEILDRLGE